MLAKYAIAGLAGSALLASVAFAQNPTRLPTPIRRQRAAPAAASDTSSFKGNWRASKLVGLNVYNDNNESLGSINDLLTDKSGNIKAVVIGVGGFLGVGEHLVAVPFDKVKFVDEPVAYTGASAPRRRPAPHGRRRPRRRVRRPRRRRPRQEANPWYPDHAVFNATKDRAEGDAGVQVFDQVSVGRELTTVANGRTASLPPGLLLRGARRAYRVMVQRILFSDAHRRC